MTEMTQKSGDAPDARDLLEEPGNPWWRFEILLVALLLLLGTGAAGYWLKASQTPAEGSADVGFARDMSDHHRQAVEMASLLYDRTDDETMRVLAYDILTTQQAQIGIMGGWLDAWGYRWFDSGPRMAWMGMPVEGRMPGMATPAEMNTLRDARGLEADAIFIQLMIPHHRSGVLMAGAATQQAKTEIVRNLAQGMAAAQQAEIEYMQQLLQEKGFETVPEAPLMDMGQ